MDKSAASSGNMTKRRLMLWRVLVLAGFALVLAAALSIPTYWETTTLWYKVGVDKTMLKGGQYVGLTTLVLIYLQVVLSTRGAFMEQLFGAPRLLKLHRYNGILICLLAACHIFLVLAPEGLANLPIGKKFWPEMVGSALFLLIALMALTSQFRQRLKLGYAPWRKYHRLLGYLVVLLVTVHVLFVSESFEQTVPRIFLLTLISGLTIWVSVVKWPGLKAEWKLDD